MLYAILLQLKNWVQYQIWDILQWLKSHNGLRPGYGQASKDYRDMCNLSYLISSILKCW